MFPRNMSMIVDRHAAGRPPAEVRVLCPRQPRPRRSGRRQSEFGRDLNSESRLAGQGSTPVAPGSQPPPGGLPQRTNNSAHFWVRRRPGPVFRPCGIRRRRRRNQDRASAIRSRALRVQRRDWARATKRRGLHSSPWHKPRWLQSHPATWLRVVAMRWIDSHARARNSDRAGWPRHKTLWPCACLLQYLRRK